MKLLVYGCSEQYRVGLQLQATLLWQTSLLWSAHRSSATSVAGMLRCAPPEVLDARYALLASRVKGAGGRAAQHRSYDTSTVQGIRFKVSPSSSGGVPGSKSRRSAWLDFTEI
eukprot:4478053-Pleurochrysis_carterae.AAC.3